MKVAGVIGHHDKSKGAYSKHLGMNEFDFYTEVCKHLKRIDIFTHDSSIRRYRTRVRNTAKTKLDPNNYDLVIEMHFNAFDKEANGCETLYFYKSKKGYEYAKKFSKIVSECTGITLRPNQGDGTKALVNKNDRGQASVYYPKAPTILIEPFFGDNKEDCDKIMSPEHLAQIIQEFVDSL